MKEIQLRNTFIQETNFHLPTSYNSNDLQRLIKLVCHVIFLNSLFMTKKKENQKSVKMKPKNARIHSPLCCPVILHDFGFIFL